MKSKSYLIYLFIVIITFPVYDFSWDLSDSPIPGSSRQLIMVLTDSAASTKGILVYYNRVNEGSSWTLVNDTIPAVLGKNGLGWGRGLHQIDPRSLPVKIEGDGRSPAGVFKLGSAFGYASTGQMGELKVPYIHVTELLECIDDTGSLNYNQVISRSDVKNPDWQSSEKMYYSGIWYEQGVVILHNADPVIKGAGSCIFLHNWSQSDETTSGCTEIKSSELKNVIFWLNSEENPVFVQLTRQLYNQYKNIWGLPR